MEPCFAYGNHKTITKVLKLRQKAQSDKATRVALRLQAILLSLKSYTSGEISNLLHVHRTRVHAWIRAWNNFGEEGLWEGHRSGRPEKLSNEDLEKLTDIIDSGPSAYGLDTGVWTSVIIKEIIIDEFGVEYHPGHIRKLLKKIGFSVQRPTTKLMGGDPAAQRKWVRYTYPNLKKKPKKRRE